MKISDEYKSIEKTLRESGFQNRATRNEKEKTLTIEVTDSLEKLYVYDRLERSRLGQETQVKLDFYYPLVPVNFFSIYSKYKNNSQNK